MYVCMYVCMYRFDWIEKTLGDPFESLDESFDTWIEWNVEKRCTWPKNFRAQQETFSGEQAMKR